MSTICYYVLWLTTFGFPRLQNEQDTTGFRINRGTNIAHWLSQSNARGKAREDFFTLNDIRQIKTMGFDHIRLPVDEVQLWDSTGVREDDAFRLLDSCLQWCQRENLKVVLDLHILRSHYFDAEVKPLWTEKTEQDKFIGLWKDLSDAVKKYPVNMLAYEFMNEPVADDPEDWNRLLARVTDSVRSWEKDRVLVIGSNRWQSASTFDQLKIPPGDKNIILSFHFYEPFMLTHYKASWTDLKDFQGIVEYPGQIAREAVQAAEKKSYDKAGLEKMMFKPFLLADSLGLPLYCGEFGAIHGSPRGPALSWYRDMVSIFSERGIAWANWNYKAGSFGIVNRKGEEDSSVVKILLSSIERD